MPNETDSKQEKAKKVRRRDMTPVCVYCTEEEKKQIQVLAKETGLWNWDVGAEFRISIKKPELQGLRP